MLSVAQQPSLWRLVFSRDHYFVLSECTLECKDGPMSKKARKQLIVFAIPVYLFILGVLISATMNLVSTCERLEFLPVFLNDWVTLNLLNLVDMLILDWLLFVTL